jgi:hypothetical protein
MKSARQVALVLCAAASSSQIGCVAETDVVEEQTAEAQQGVIVHNALTINALTINALTINALTINALTINALTAEALLSNELTGPALRDPNARELLSFIVSCALPPRSSVDIDVDGVAYSYPGQIGLAPEWGRSRGRCGEECQEWVSGCVLARINYLGEHVAISIRGNHRALYAPPSEQAAFPRREATYYGNIFATPQERFACLSPGQTQIPRTCGPSIDDCALDVLGSCDDLCKRPRPDGSFPSCRDAFLTRPAHVVGVPPVGAETYKGAVTVFLR